ncbi:hypothetical protein [Hymenobacter sp. BRD67]|uniref:hypothetical protein n=1 Tax=Hymenobacter sp. BRD67 TaxID=2675877 RepID=UPI0015677A80|nr:hypothetical protein [Hymenobacter sp. BRD67]QKG52609.1 hypothetical protein GKZ67_08360 [Hymenobacter sp. BRD67]
MIYKIDQTKLSSFKKRAMLKELRTLLVGWLIIMAIQFPRFAHHSLKTFVIVSLGIIPLAALRLYVGSKTLGQLLSTYKIELTDDKISYVLNARVVRSIPWEIAAYELKSDGRISIRDKSISGFLAQITGKGMITVPPEIEDRQEFLEQLESNCEAV